MARWIKQSNNRQQGASGGKLFGEQIMEQPEQKTCGASKVRRNIVTENTEIETGEFTLEELKKVMKKLKKGQAAGPAGVPMDIPKL